MKDASNLNTPLIPFQSIQGNNDALPRYQYRDFEHLPDGTTQSSVPPSIVIIREIYSRKDICNLLRRG